MALISGIFFFALGAACASFAGVLAARLHTGQSWFAGRSRCDACGSPLQPGALVPIVSYAAVGGRARCCGARISPLAPISEAVLGSLFVLAYLSLGLTVALPFFLLALVLLSALTLYDLAHSILPSVLLWPFVAAAGVAGFLGSSSWHDFLQTALVAALIALSLAAVHFFSRGRAMGLADAPLAFGLSLLAGGAAFPGFVFSFWIGAVVGIVLLLRRPAGSRMGVEVPFAPFLAAGFLLAYFTQWNPFLFIAAFH